MQDVAETPSPLAEAFIKYNGLTIDELPKITDQGLVEVDIEIHKIYKRAEAPATPYDGFWYTYKIIKPDGTIVRPQTFKYRNSPFNADHKIIITFGASVEQPAVSLRECGIFSNIEVSYFA